MMKKVVFTSQYFSPSTLWSYRRVAKFFQDRLTEIPEQYQESAKAMFDVNREGDIKVEIFYEQPGIEQEENRKFS